MAKNRKIRKVLKSKPTIEGAGVHLRRVFGNSEVPLFDPFLLLDDFRNADPYQYIRRVSLASPSRNRDDHLCPGGQTWNTATAWGTRASSIGRRAVDDRRQRHHSPGNAPGRQ